MERTALMKAPVLESPPLVLLVSVLIGVLLSASAAPSAVEAQPLSDAAEQQAAPSPIIVDDFESYKPGSFPEQWVFVKRDKSVISYDQASDPGETVEVKKQSGNRYLRVSTKGEALRYTQRNGKEFDWNLKTHSRIAWRWRAVKLPDGASERGENDTGGALYVTFGSDWLGRPKSIKYTYSSSLPVGSVVSFGPLKVIVVDSAREPRMGEWKEVMRDIPSDYRQVFGEDPPNRPLSITFWSDSDTTDDTAEVHFDDIRLLPPFERK
ncbi:hypothetical protein CRI94_14930 [Longibacter salinarum]|uniref:DUF3047 domain-containing protein n=1 Tax=Longibacter salinarum TaxID=1850348 RepID=A0A2A8CVP1_9BACT|nr:DUF3047 domain-containing protein [Longibacter salinarum]PEN12315.1 hypothetical protein CRI94_14930 [Longibacter salinarum]